MKFGGSVLDSPLKIKTLVDIVRSFRNKADSDELICVISAISGVTDKIFMLSDSLTRSDKKAIKSFIDEMSSLHLELINKVIDNPSMQQEAKNAVLEIMGEFQAILEGLVLIAEITPRSLDYILSFWGTLDGPDSELFSKKSTFGLKLLHWQGNRYRYRFKFW